MDGGSLTNAANCSDGFNRDIDRRRKAVHKSGFVLSSKFAKLLSSLCGASSLLELQHRNPARVRQINWLRDPLKIAASGMLYHLGYSDSGEQWLFRSMTDHSEGYSKSAVVAFASQRGIPLLPPAKMGEGYQAYLRRLETDEARLLAEMTRFSGLLPRADGGPPTPFIDVAWHSGKREPSTLDKLLESARLVVNKWHSYTGVCLDSLMQQNASGYASVFGALLEFWEVPPAVRQIFIERALPMLMLAPVTVPPSALPLPSASAGVPRASPQTHSTGSQSRRDLHAWAYQLDTRFFGGAFSRASVDVGCKAGASPLRSGRTSTQSRQSHISGGAASMAPPRQLLYKHLAKTGGQTIKHAIAALAVQGGNVASFQERTIVSEDERGSAFFVSSTRNPCDFYVSLWAYGCTGHGRYAQHDFVDKFPSLRHVFDDPANYSNFRAFARAAAGEFSRRYRDYMPGKLSADCWVHTDALPADLLGCLERFRGRGGVLPGPLPTPEQINAWNLHRTPHDKCATYYQNDPALVRLVLARDATLFATFGEYGGFCCSKAAARHVPPPRAGVPLLCPGRRADECAEGWPASTTPPPTS